MFGRGAEEAEALRAAGIPYEIVPGVTAAFAAGALPRSPSPTGRVPAPRPGDRRTKSRARRPARLGRPRPASPARWPSTWASTQLGHIVRELRHGMSPDTPAALVEPGVHAGTSGR